MVLSPLIAPIRHHGHPQSRIHELREPGDTADLQHLAASVGSLTSCSHSWTFVSPKAVPLGEV